VNRLSGKRPIRENDHPGNVFPGKKPSGKVTIWETTVYPMKHPVTDRVKPSFVIFDIRALLAQGWASECPDIQNYKWSLTRSGTGCFIATMATVGVKGLKIIGVIVSRRG